MLLVGIRCEYMADDPQANLSGGDPSTHVDTERERDRKKVIVVSIVLLQMYRCRDRGSARKAAIAMLLEASESSSCCRHAHTSRRKGNLGGFKDNLISDVVLIFT